MLSQELATNALTRTMPGPAKELHSTASMKYLSFRLGDEEYGIDIMRVQEIRNYEKVTGIASSPAHIKGIMNLRGMIVPIVDMRLLLNVGEAKYDPFTIVIVLNLGARTIGMVVDSVSEVIDLQADSIKPAPDLASTAETNHMKGIGTIDGRMLILLDIDHIMSSDEMGVLETKT